MKRVKLTGQVDSDYRGAEAGAGSGRPRCGALGRPFVREMAKTWQRRAQRSRSNSPRSPN